MISGSIILSKPAQLFISAVAQIFIDKGSLIGSMELLELIIHGKTFIGRCTWFDGYKRNTLKQRIYAISELFEMVRQTGLEQRPRAFQSPSNSAKTAVLRSFPIACLLRSLLTFSRIKNR